MLADKFFKQIFIILFFFSFGAFYFLNLLISQSDRIMDNFRKNIGEIFQ